MLLILQVLWTLWTFLSGCLVKLLHYNSISKPFIPHPIKYGVKILDIVSFITISALFANKATIHWEWYLSNFPRFNSWWCSSSHPNKGRSLHSTPSMAQCDLHYVFWRQCSDTRILILIKASIYLFITNKIWNHFGLHLKHILSGLDGDPFNDNIYVPCSTKACNLGRCPTKMEGRIDLLHIDLIIEICCPIRWERVDLFFLFWVEWAN